MHKHIDSNPSPISDKGIEFAQRSVREATRRIEHHKKFIAQGGQIHWVIDADVFRFFVTPQEIEQCRYVDLFLTLGIENSPSAGLQNLSYLLGDFIFSKRFTLTDSNHSIVNRLVLDPHTEEVDNQISHFLKNTHRESIDAHRAVGGRLAERVISLTKEYAAGRGSGSELSVHDFKNRLLQDIEDAVSILRPAGGLAALRNAHDVLKVRGLKYQADIPELQQKLTTPEVIEMLKERTDFWFYRLKDFFGQLRTKDDMERASGRAINHYRDAEVLAKIEFLNKNENLTKTRYVLLSGTSYLNALLRQFEENGTPNGVHLLTPISFLGNPHLFEADIQGAFSTHENDSARLKQLTAGINLWLNPNPGKPAVSPQAISNEDRVALFEEWQSLENLSKPYLTARASPYLLPKKEEILKAIFTGESLEALETQLYLAMCEFFALTARFGLQSQEQMQLPSIPKRKPPPLRMATYPLAEEFICDLVERKLWDDQGSIKKEKLKSSFAAIDEEMKKAQRQSDHPNFQYTLLLCYGARYATLGDWHACRVMASHARALSEHSTVNEHCHISGREAAYLESYSRRLEAKDSKDLDKAGLALEEFKTCFDTTEPNWRTDTSAAGQPAKYKAEEANPSKERDFHWLRYKTELQCIEFARLVFACFPSNGQTLLQQPEHQTAFEELMKKALNLQQEVHQALHGSRHMQQASAVSNQRCVLACLTFAEAQLALCALQCALFLDSSNSIAIPDELRQPSLWKLVHAHQTEVAVLAASVAELLWGSDPEQKLAAKKAFDSIPRPSASGNPGQYPHDSGRYAYFLSLIGRPPAKPL